MNATAFAQLLSNTLYYRRFFPFYTFNVVGGLDAEGKGAVFGYDAIGSFERVPYVVTGSGSALITSILDSQVRCKAVDRSSSSQLTRLQVQFKTHKKNFKELSVDKCLDVVKDAFASGAERDIQTGDYLDIVIITKDGVSTDRIDLNKD